MGVYHKIACDECKESIDPGNINDLGIKTWAIASPEHWLGILAVFAMTSRWDGNSVRLVNDTAYDQGYFMYTDVTKEVIEAYNEKYGTDLRYTG